MQTLGEITINQEDLSAALPDSLIDNQTIKCVIYDVEASELPNSSYSELALRIKGIFRKLPYGASAEEFQSEWIQSEAEANQIWSYFRQKVTYPSAAELPELIIYFENRLKSLHTQLLKKRSKSIIKNLFEQRRLERLVSQTERRIFRCKIRQP